MPDSAHIDSQSVGDGERFRSLGELERLLHQLRPPPREKGTVSLIVRRGEPSGRRDALQCAMLTPADGLPGDAWGRQLDPHPESQLTAMQTGVAELIANGQPLSLFGDNLFLDFDLSAGNLPPGSRLSIGNAVLEVTPLPHTGCAAFRSRFGDGALRFTSKPEFRLLNLRGIHLRVISGGEVRQGGSVTLLSRPAAE